MEEPKSPLVRKINHYGILAAAVACAVGGLYLFFVKEQWTALFMAAAGVMLFYATLRKQPEEPSADNQETDTAKEPDRK